MSYTPYNAPLLAGLLGDAEMTKQFSVREEVETMIAIEGALTLCMARAKLIPDASAQAILNAFAGFEPTLDALGKATARDGVVVPELVRQLRAAVGPDHSNHVHMGATSQDIIDTSMVLRLRKILDIAETRLIALLEQIDHIMEMYGSNPLIGRTRMQAGMPITVRDRGHDWANPLKTHLQRLSELKPRLLVLQFGGPVGNLKALGDKGREVAAFLAKDLKLALPEKAWHNDRSALVEFCNCFALISGSLGKVGQDIALMAQNEIAEIVLGDTGGSSAMPHKQNPIKAEVLVTLARFNATLISGMQQAMVHEQERSGSAWTLEWMILPQICIATGASTLRAKELLQSIQFIGAKR